MMIRSRRFANSEVANGFLREFADRYVKGTFRARWIHILCERPDKALGELHKFDRHVATTACRPLSGEEARHESLLSLLGDTDGIFFDGQGPALMTSLGDVLSKLSPYQDDGLFSMYNGACALFFHHDGTVWYCGERPAARPSAPVIR